MLLRAMIRRDSRRVVLLLAAATALRVVCLPHVLGDPAASGNAAGFPRNQPTSSAVLAACLAASLGFQSGFSQTRFKAPGLNRTRLERRIGLASFDRSCAIMYELSNGAVHLQTCTGCRYYYTVDTKQKMFYSAITADLEVL